MDKDFVLKLLDKASDRDLMLSRKNCHIKGLHSIVIQEDIFGRLLRLYLADHKHQLNNCMRDDLNINLGVHNHRYDLQLTAVHGKAANIIYRLSDSLHSNLRVDSYKFYDKDNFTNGGRVFLKRKSIKLIDNIFIGKDELHTVYVPTNTTASWLVQEGFELRNYTMLYTNKSINCESYTTFQDPDEVRNFVTDYYLDYTQ